MGVSIMFVFLSVRPVLWRRYCGGGVLFWEGKSIQGNISFLSILFYSSPFPSSIPLP